jgi:hypothetical protein
MIDRFQDYLMALYQLLWVCNVRRQDGKDAVRICLDSKAYQTSMPNCCTIILLLLCLPTGAYQLASLVQSFPYSKYLCPIHWHPKTGKVETILGYRPWSSHNDNEKLLLNTQGTDFTSNDFVIITSAIISFPYMNVAYHIQHTT